MINISLNPIRSLWLIVVPLFAASIVAADLQSGDYVDISRIEHVRIDLRYASSNNFTGQDLYGNFRTPYLHKVAADKLAKAATILLKKRPDWQLLVFDALRPRSVQKVLWQKVKGTAQESYVANPRYGSIHNYGFAIDLSLVDGEGKEVDMGTPFDDFSRLAQPRLENQFLAEGKLTTTQVANRKLLREIMESAGFIQLPVEWWHYDALPKTEIKARYKIIE